MGVIVSNRQFFVDILETPAYIEEYFMVTPTPYL